MVLDDICDWHTARPGNLLQTMNKFVIDAADRATRFVLSVFRNAAIRIEIPREKFEFPMIA
jgi:hypothetical protein